MADLFDRYGVPASPASPAAGGDLFDRYTSGSQGGMQDWEPEGYSGGQMAARKVGLAAQGTTDALISNAAAPLDISGWLSRATGLVGQNTPPISAAFKQAADDVASVPLRIRDAVSQGSFDPLFATRDAYSTRIDPVTTGERTAYGAGQGAGNALAMVAPAGVVGRVAAPGSITQGVASTLAAQPVMQTVAGGVAGAVTGATDNPWYGLGAGVWTRKMNTAYRAGRAIQAGRVWTNCYHAYPAHAAFGGYKSSGIGRENHKMMLDHYQQTKNLLVSYSESKLGFF